MTAKKISTCIFLTFLFAIFLGFFLFGNGGFGSIRNGIIKGVVFIFHVFIFFMIFYTGKTNKWRKIFFTAYAIAFVISFVWWTMGDRGHMWLLDSEILYSQTPMCHIVVPMLLLPIFFTGKIIFPAEYSSAAFMILMVIVVSLIFGRAFCSWGCFFGGQDELFSSVSKKSRWKIKDLHPFIRYFSFGMLIFIILHSFATMSPTYCWWFCPFKTGSEFIEVNSFTRVLQTFLFVSLWAILVVLLPILSKKRIQCSLFCPFGAFLSCTSKINIFGLKIDKDKCTNCNLCISVCPNLAITKDSLSMGKASITCSKCGACIDKCPQKAISYSVLGANPPVREKQDITKNNFLKTMFTESWDPAVFFIFGIFSLSVIMASGNFTQAISRLINYFFGI
jgi:ferredoxin-type protein NapH